MHVKKRGSFDYWEFMGSILGISILGQIMELWNIWIDSKIVLTVLFFISIALVVLSGKRGFSSKYYDVIEMFGFAYLILVYVMYLAFGDLFEFLQDYQIKMALMLVCSIVFFAMAKRD